MDEPAVKTIRWIKKDNWYSVSDCGRFTIDKAITMGRPIFTAWHKVKKWQILFCDRDVNKAIAACEKQKEKGKVNVRAGND